MFTSFAVTLRTEIHFLAAAALPSTFLTNDGITME